MASLAIVKHLQILKDGLSGLMVARPVLPVGLFPLQGGKEALEQRVILAITL